MSTNNEIEDLLDYISEKLMDELDLEEDLDYADPDTFLYKVPNGIKSEVGRSVMVADFLSEHCAAQGEYGFLTGKDGVILETMIRELPDDELVIVCNELNNPALRQMANYYLRARRLDYGPSPR